MVISPHSFIRWSPYKRLRNPDQADTIFPSTEGFREYSSLDGVGTGRLGYLLSGSPSVRAPTRRRRDLCPTRSDRGLSRSPVSPQADGNTVNDTTSAVPRCSSIRGGFSLCVIFRHNLLKFMS